MDRFNEEIYGKVLWECYRSKVYIVTLSLMYVLLGAAAVIWAMDKDQFLFYVLAVVVIFFCLWRIQPRASPGRAHLRKEAARGSPLVLFHV